MANKTWTGASSTAYNTAGNWSLSGVPVGADNQFFDHAATRDLSTSLDQSAVTGAGVIDVLHSFSKFIGDGTNYYKLGLAKSFIGRKVGPSAGSGSNRLTFDFGAVAHESTVYDTATSSATGEENLPPVRLLGSDLTLHVLGGSVGVGLGVGETATLTELRVGERPGGTTPNVYLGRGVQITEGSVSAGTVTNFTDQTVNALRVSGGVYEALGVGDHTGLIVAGGTCFFSGEADIADLTVYGGGEMSFVRSAVPRVVEACTLYHGAVLDIDNGVPGSVTFPNGITLVGCKLADVDIRTPPDLFIEISEL